MATTSLRSDMNATAILSPAEAHAFFDEQARLLAGMSGQTFLERWDAGAFRDLDETPEGRRLAYLATLIPFGRQDT